MYVFFKIAIQYLKERFLNTIVTHDGAANIKDTPKTFMGVQYLRAIAALMIVAFHAVNVVRDRIDANAWQLNIGNARVDVFFAISGLMIVLTTYRHWGQVGFFRKFLKRRLIRVVPLYWLATSMKLAVILVLPSIALSSGQNWWHIIASYLFIPAYNDSGMIFPLLVPGWTLNFEILFYIIFAIALWLRLSPIKFVIPIFFGMVAIRYAFGPFEWAPMSLFSERLLTFCLGMMIGLAVKRQQLLSLNASMLIIPIAIFLLLAGNHVFEVPLGEMPFLMWGVPAGVLIYALISFEYEASIADISILHKLGDASYCIFLFHPFVVTPIAMVVKKLSLGTPASLAVVAVSALVVSSIVGYVIHLRLEKPFLAYMRRRFDA